VAVTQDELYATLDLDLSWSEAELPERERTKHVHRLHPYHGKFIPQLVEVLLDRYLAPGDRLLDPFAGSGTTLVQALESGLDATGVDIAAFNCLLMCVKTAPYDLAELGEELRDVAVAVLRDELAEVEELGGRVRCVPLTEIAAQPPPAQPERLDAAERVPQLVPELGEVVRSCLDAHQEAVERGDVHARRVESRLERLDERRARAGKGVEDVVARREVAPEQHLHELRDELAVVRVEAMDVLRPLALAQLGLRPREVEVQRRVQLVLRDGHGGRVRYSGSQPSP